MTLTHTGGCHCGALRWSLQSNRTAAELVPRACDCDFCTRHGAAWLSDPEGLLVVRASPDDVQRYRQGSGQAEFLICRHCSVLVAVIARMPDGREKGAVNRNAFDQPNSLADPVVVSPQQLAADAKLSRWTQAWTPLVWSSRDGEN